MKKLDCSALVCYDVPLTNGMIFVRGHSRIDSLPFSITSLTPC